MEWDGKNSQAVNYWAEQTAGNAESKINSGSARVNADNPKKVAPAGGGAGSATPVVHKRAYGNDDSVYLTMEVGKVSNNNNSATNFVGLTKVTGTYTGVQDADLKVYAKTADEIKELDNTPGIIAVFDEDLYIIGAVVVGEDNSSSNSYIYALDSAKNEYIEGDYTYWEMDAVVDGEIKTVTVKDKYGNMKADINASTGKSHPGEDCLLKVTYDKDGYVVDIEQAPSPDANTDVWYTAADYTGDIEDGPAGAAGSEFKVYSVEYAHTSTDDKPGPAEFYRVGRTLYNRTATHDGNFDTGLTLGSGGSVIVVQNEVSNTGKISRVWESFSDLQNAIDYLADADTFEGYVSAC